MGKWTKNELNICIEMVKDGNSYYNISLIVPRTERAIREKLRKNGYRYIDFYNNEENKEEIICLECGIKSKSYKKENRKFCSKSCSTTYNNKYKLNYDFHKKRRKIKKCLCCDVKLNSNNKKYCNSNCCIEYKKKLIFEKIENGIIDLPNRNYKKYLIHKYGDKCMKCGWCEIHTITGNVPIQLEHKDGDSKNNHLGNLELLCPNCHSLTPTYGALNKGNSTRNERQLYRKYLKNLTINELIKERKLNKN